MKLSIIIPTLNEEGYLDRLLKQVSRKDDRLHEILVVDGGSTDRTLSIAQHRGVHVISAPEPNRGMQLKLGAEHAAGDILYFIHADTLPPQTFLDDIEQGLAQGYDLGRYFSCYESGPLIMRLNAWLTLFDFHMARGGDQTLFITRELYDRAGGFDPRYVLFEDYDLVGASASTGQLPHHEKAHSHFLAQV